MKNKSKLFTLSGLTIMAVSLMFLSACSVFSSSGNSSQIDTLQTQVAANTAQITALQTQVQDLQTKVSALQAAPTTPKVTTTTPPTTHTTTPAPSNVLPPGSVGYTSLSISPQSGLTTDTYTISVTVKNSSTSSGPFHVVVTEKMVAPYVSTDIIEYAKDITLQANETQTVTFTTTKDLTSTYAVTAGSQSAQYSVFLQVPTTTDNGG